MSDAAPGPAADYSIIIPAYNEAIRLPASLARLRSYLAGERATAQVIVVDDGSQDATAAVAMGAAANWPALRLLRTPHQGKGGAVRAGIAAAAGTYVVLCDADLSVPPEELRALSARRGNPDDIIIGSRQAPGARRYNEPPYRHIMGRGFNLLVRLLLVPGIQDTQCGFKWLRRDIAAELCRLQVLDGWGFDAELLFLARTRGYRIVEVPVPWYFVAGSRVRPIANSLTMLCDIARVRLRAWRGGYAAVPLAPPPERQACDAGTSHPPRARPLRR